MVAFPAAELDRTTFEAADELRETTNGSLAVIDHRRCSRLVGMFQAPPTKLGVLHFRSKHTSLYCYSVVTPDTSAQQQQQQQRGSKRSRACTKSRRFHEEMHDARPPPVRSRQKVRVNPRGSLKTTNNLTTKTQTIPTNYNVILTPPPTRTQIAPD